MNILIFLLGLYVILECAYAAQYLNKGGRFCQFVKYLTSCAVGAIACYYSIKSSLSWEFVVALIAISASMWPGTFYRFTNHYERRFVKTNE